MPDALEEVLEHLWIMTEEQDRPVLSGNIADTSLQALQRRALVEVRDGRVFLTGRGRDESESCIRRHRLAERLLSDILAGGEDEIHAAGCKFEHGLHRGLEEKVCTLLGHPAKCPHGRPIPRGDCCRRMERQTGQLLSPLTELSTGESGVIAYLHSKERGDLRKLMAIGALPGVRVTVRQRFPSYLLEMAESQFAIDSELAAQIYVRRAGAPLE